MLIGDVTDRFKITTLNNGIFKVNVQSEPDYGNLTRILRDHVLEYFTYENKHEL